jgi:hypothetical protein
VALSAGATGSASASVSGLPISSTEEGQESSWWTATRYDDTPVYHRASTTAAALAWNKAFWWVPLALPERPGKTCFRFWQEGPGHDRNIFAPEAIRASIDYMHKNPVERELCTASSHS